MVEVGSTVVVVSRGSGGEGDGGVEGGVVSWGGLYLMVHTVVQLIHLIYSLIHSQKTLSR